MHNDLDAKQLSRLEAWAAVFEKALPDLEERGGAFAADLVKWSNETMVDAAPFEQVRTRPSRRFEEPDVVNGWLALRAHRLMERLREIVRRSYPLELRHRNAERVLRFCS